MDQLTARGRIGAAVVVRAPGRRLSPVGGARRPGRNGSDRPIDGVRQHGDELRFGRRLHERPGLRRGPPLRRLPPQRAGRRHRGRSPRWRATPTSSSRPSPGSPTSSNRSASGSKRIFHDAQDFEFTVEDGALWMLQTRSAKRTPLAALRIACDLVDEGLIDTEHGRGTTGRVRPRHHLNRTTRHERRPDRLRYRAPGAASHQAGRR